MNRSSVMIREFLPLIFTIIYSSVQGQMYVHQKMTKIELAHHFGVLSPHEVDPQSYEVVTIMKEPNRIMKRSLGHENVEGNIFRMRAFGRDISIKTKRNTKLLHPNATIVTVDGPKPRLSLAKEDEWPTEDCHFITEDDEEFVGGLSECGEDDEIMGFLLSDEDILEIGPMNKELNEEEDGEVKHIVVRRTLNSSHLLNGVGKIGNFQVPKIRKRGKPGKNNKIIETGVFLGPKAYDTYMKFYKTEKKVRDLILSYMNGIQAIYHYPSLEQKVDFTIVRLEFLKSWVFPSKNGEREQLLKSFCNYQSKENPGDDSNPKHWDIGLFVSGMDFWAKSGGKRSYVTMGLATVTGICTKRYGCVIGEIGVRSKEGAPYPSTGFTSIFVMAHEIGHNLGMNHDGTGNSCPKNGYVMSGSRGTKGETVWSQCSANFLASLDMDCLNDTPTYSPSLNDHNKYGNRPGYTWSADEQCQVLLQDKKAVSDHTSSNVKNVCNSLKCKVPHKSGYWRSGPALDGTRCDFYENKICLYGKCVRDDTNQISSAKPTWSDWTQGPCKSGCIVKSRGARKRERTCNVPKPLPLMTRCPGPSSDISLCDDYPVCPEILKPSEWASRRCKEFKKRSSRLNLHLTTKGRRARHNVRNPEQGCMVYCQTKKTREYYAPKMELNNFRNIDVYFPEGSWCHNDGVANYYCTNHRCTSTQRGARAERSPEIKLNQNAKPPSNTVDGQSEIQIPDQIVKYFTIDQNDDPLGDSLPSGNEDNDDIEFEQPDAIRPEDLDQDTI